MLTMDDIVREGHPALRQVTEEVPMPPSEEDKNTLKEMLEFLQNSQDPETAEKYELRSGVGLAAPQLGINKRMFAVHVTDEKDRLYSYGLFNPKITRHSVEMTHLEGGEGCLSVDREVPGNVPRYKRITLEGTTLEGEKVRLRLRDLPAIVFQHELDHLNGVMFYDRIEEEIPETNKKDDGAL
ncbi:peptide deformylase [Salibacterium qingdaonense]|uniref:Peptide deformylase n=1 Tax=Salibacterium qingdaonense TaxID=266892 RepID=A0A1I4ISV5_9BACI|nr:peptide deformylase [Salibacterium qingdaonense]SFL57073.1 peptide deformylase [Salibacterium qingdaonense]